MCHHYDATKLGPVCFQDEFTSFFLHRLRNVFKFASCNWVLRFLCWSVFLKPHALEGGITLLTDLMCLYQITCYVPAMLKMDTPNIELVQCPYSDHHLIVLLAPTICVILDIIMCIIILLGSNSTPGKAICLRLLNCKYLRENGKNFAHHKANVA